MVYGFCTSECVCISEGGAWGSTSKCRLHYTIDNPRYSWLVPWSCPRRQPDSICLPLLTACAEIAMGPHYVGIKLTTFRGHNRVNVRYLSFNANFFYLIFMKKSACLCHDGRLWSRQILATVVSIKMNWMRQIFGLSVRFSPTAVKTKLIHFLTLNGMHVST